MRYLHSFILAILLIMSGCLACGAKDVNPYDGYDETIFMDMSLEDNIKTPVVHEKEHPAIKSYMNKLANDLAKRNYIVDLTRDDEVIIVTIPTDDLFLPNDTLLSPSAPAKLSPIVNLFSDPAMMKMVYAVHTDNTGSPSYNMRLSHERNNSIYDWMLDNINEDLIVIPFEMGDTDPLVSNSSREGRAENRRLEIYFIPGPKMILNARKGILK